MLTDVSIDALLALAERLPRHRNQIAATLRSGFPEPKTGADERDARACLKLAKRIHAALERLTGKTHEFPETYDARTRQRLIASWK